jgi:hypothetical protein
MFQISGKRMDASVAGSFRNLASYRRGVCSGLISFMKKILKIRMKEKINSVHS